jgi:hypothetical protein
VGIYRRHFVVFLLRISEFAAGSKVDISASVLSYSHVTSPSLRQHYGKSKLQLFYNYNLPAGDLV